MINRIYIFIAVAVLCLATTCQAGTKHTWTHCTPTGSSGKLFAESVCNEHIAELDLYPDGWRYNKPKTDPFTVSGAPIVYSGHINIDLKLPHCNENQDVIRRNNVYVCVDRPAPKVVKAEDAVNIEALGWKFCQISTTSICAAWYPQVDAIIVGKVPGWLGCQRQTYNGDGTVTVHPYINCDDFGIWSFETMHAFYAYARAKHPLGDDDVKVSYPEMTLRVENSEENTVIAGPEAIPGYKKCTKVGGCTFCEDANGNTVQFRDFSPEDLPKTTRAILGCRKDQLTIYYTDGSQSCVDLPDIYQNSPLWDGHEVLNDPITRIDGKCYVDMVYSTYPPQYGKQEIPCLFSTPDITTDTNRDGSITDGSITTRGTICNKDQLTVHNEDGSQSCADLPISMARCVVGQYLIGLSYIDGELHPICIVITKQMVCDAGEYAAGIDHRGQMKCEPIHYKNIADMPPYKCIATDGHGGYIATNCGGR